MRFAKDNLPDHVCGTWILKDFKARIMNHYDQVFAKFFIKFKNIIEKNSESIDWIKSQIQEVKKQKKPANYCQ